jgi:hypothetical protein
MNLDLVNKYMNGRCHALAYILSATLQKDLAALYGVHENGRRIEDPLHIFVLMSPESDSDPLILDIKGQRHLSEMKKDFDSLIDLVKHHQGEVITLTCEGISFPSDLYDELGFDQGHVPDAANDLSSEVWNALEFPGKPCIDSSFFKRSYT